MSMSANPGASTVLRPESPNVNGAGSEKQPVLNHCAGLPAPPTLGSQVTSGRCAGPEPMFARSVPRFTVNGAPDCSVTMPLACQFFPNVASHPPPLGFGSAYVAF